MQLSTHPSEGHPTLVLLLRAKTMTQGRDLPIPKPSAFAYQCRKRKTASADLFTATSQCCSEPVAANPQAAFRVQLP